MKLPDRNLLDGSKTPVTSTAEMKVAQGDQRDFIAAMLGTDSDDKEAARASLGVSAATDEQAGKSKFAVAGGSADAMTVVLTPALIEFVDGMEIRARCSGSNATTVPTLKVNDLPAAVITSADGSVLPSGSYLAGWPATFRYRAPASPAAARFELLNPVPVTAGAPSSVRQTVLSGAVDSSGLPNALSAGSGLALNLTAAAVALTLSFASGFDAGGETNSISRLASDVTGVLTGLPANNLSYVMADYATANSVNWGKSLAPPQYGRIYDRSRQALLHFDGAAGVTSMLDDFGNVWTAQGGAKLQTNQSKFGGSALGGGGASNALNGTSDYVSSTSVTSLGSGSWSMRGHFFISSLAALRPIYAFENAAGVGAYLRINTAGKTELYLSSNGTTWDIANQSVGTQTLSTGQFHFIELTFDAAAGKYIVYVNTVADNTVTSALRVCGGFTVNYLGREGSSYFAGYIDEFEILPYCDHPNGVTYTAPSAPQSVAAAGYASDFFSIAEMKMFKVSGPATVVGGSPAFTAVKRLYVGEALAGSAGISSIVNYAHRAQYDSGWTNTLFVTLTSRNHNIGMGPLVRNIEFMCLAADGGFSPGDVTDSFVTYDTNTIASKLTLGTTRTAIFGNVSNQTPYYGKDKSTGASFQPTASKWAYRFTASRGW